MGHRALLLRASLLQVTMPMARGHAYLSQPQARNFGKNDKNGWMPQSGNGAGICGDGGQWPKDSNFVDYLDGPKTTYAAGSVVEFEVSITAHHKGHFEFKICDQEVTSDLADADGCFNKWVLERADPAGDCIPNDDRADCQPVDTANPQRWYLPPPRGIGGWWTAQVGNRIQVEKMQYKIPENLTCSKCTLQWRWWTANSCIPKPGYGCHFQSMERQGWDAKDWCGYYCGECPGSGGRPGCGEEFRNCADVTILPSGSAASLSLAQRRSPEEQSLRGHPRRHRQSTE